MFFHYIYITIDSIFLEVFRIFLVIFIFCSNFLVQSYIILVRNSMFYYKKNKSSNLVTFF